jgi:hypothetical protein
MRGSHVFQNIRTYALVPRFLVCAWRGGKDIPARTDFQKARIFGEGRGKGALYPPPSTML